MRKTLFTLVACGITVLATASATFVGVFNSTYKVDKSSKLGKAGCMVCHTSAKGGKLNAYGKDLDVAVKAAKTKKLTPALLKSIEGKDSNGDGKTNGANIKAGEMP